MLTEQELQDGKWYLVRYEGLNASYQAPAMYKKNAAAFYSYEFSGLPARQLEVLREINTENSSYQSSGYRLLNSGDVVQSSDEFIDDDCVHWLPAEPWTIGRSWHNGLKPMRRQF